MRRSVAAGFIALVSGVCLAAAAGDVPLIDAVKEQNVADVRALLQRRADVNERLGDGSTALHWAVHRNDPAVVDLLLRAGARADAANDLGVTPLHVACTNRSAALVDRLLAAGGAPNAAQLNGQTPLMTCSRAGDAAAVKALLIRGADVNAREAAHQQTALMWAAAESHPEVVRILVEAGADMTARSFVYKQNITRGGGQSTDGPSETDEYLVPRGGSTPLLFAARSGDAESASILLNAGANPNDALPDGMSALTLAAFSGRPAVANVLLEKGADPNNAEIGYTALHAAILRGDLGLVKALLARGANPNAQLTLGTPIRRSSQDFQLPKALIGATPYLLATKFLERGMMEALIAAGADPHLPLASGVTPVMAAAGAGSNANASRRGISVEDGGVREEMSRVVDVVGVALDLKGDINGVNKAGDTALHVAALLGYDPVVQLLADRGADLNIKNKRGLTPLGSLLAKDKAAAESVFNAGSPVAPASESTKALLRTLGALE